MLEIQVEDICFLIGLSRRGSPIPLSGSRRGGEAIKDYISAHSRPRSQPTKDEKIDIKDLVSLPMRMILFIIARLASSATLHFSNRSHMQYALECMKLTIFNLSEGVLENMKEQLTKVKDGWLKKFGYGSILISFALDRIPLLQPQHISLELAHPRVPQIKRWVDLISRHACSSSMSFTLVLFRWLHMHLIIVEDYPYSGMDFSGDPELVLPGGE